MVMAGLVSKPWLVLLFLLSAYISGQWSRFSLAYLSGVAIDKCKDVCAKQTLPLCEDKPGSSLECDACYVNHTASHFNLKQGTCLTEGEYSFLVSYGFIAFFATCGLFAGRLADRANRKNVVAFAALGWSFGTFVQSTARDFNVLLLSRVLMGLFTSFSAPASYSILADTFDKDNLATANGVYSLGVYLGGGLSSLSIIMAQSLGWRSASSFIASVGLVSFVLCFAVKEPERKSLAARDASEAAAKPAPTLVQAVKTTFSDGVVVLAILAASTRFLGGFALGAYLPQFYKRKFPEFNSEYSVINAFVVSFAGGVSTISGGRIADVMERKYGSYACGLIPVVGSLLGVFPILGALQVDDFYGSIFFVFVSYLLVECWFGPALKMIQTRIPKDVRALAISIYLFSGSMIGNISPIVIGYLDDGNSVHSLVKLLSVMLLISYVGCAILFGLAVVLIRRQSLRDGEAAISNTLTTPLRGDVIGGDASQQQQEVRYSALPTVDDEIVLRQATDALRSSAGHEDDDEHRD